MIQAVMATFEAKINIHTFSFHGNEFTSNKRRLYVESTLGDSDHTEWPVFPL